MNKIFLLICLFFVQNFAFSQNVGIGTTGPNTTLDVNGHITDRGLAGNSGSYVGLDATGKLIVATPPTGITGATGATGVNGSNGTNGTNGVTGVTGATGANGSNGTNGTNGATGVTGPVGCSTANTVLKSNGTSATCSIITDNGTTVGIGSVNLSNFTNSGLVVANGLFQQEVNTSNYPYYDPSGGWAAGWNTTGGSAEVDFYNTYNGAATPGGFTFYQQTGTASKTLLMTIAGQGATAGTVGITNNLIINGGTITAGKSSSASGVLQFLNSTNANIVSISSGVTSTTYSMTLPTAIGTANQSLSISSVSGSTATLAWRNPVQRIHTHFNNWYQNPTVNNYNASSLSNTNFAFEQASTGYFSQAAAPTSLQSQYAVQFQSYTANTSETVNQIMGWVCQYGQKSCNSTIYVYKYTPTNGVSYTGTLTGTLVGSQTLTFTNAGVVEALNILPSSVTMSSGDVLVIFLTSTSSTPGYYISGIIETTVNTQ